MLLQQHCQAPRVVMQNMSQRQVEQAIDARSRGSLGKHERLDYIRAVKCLREKPALSTQAYASGARSRFDDWDATHIKVSNNVHFSVSTCSLPPGRTSRTWLSSRQGLFLHFHRYFTWLYEKALRDECGYKGSQPYWDWTIDWQDPRKSSVFNGSPYSMGSNGKSIPHGNTSISAFGISLSIPPGTGGGCIESGPFANASVNLGPVAFQPVGPDGGLGYNPRCLTRDLSLAWANQTKPSDVVKTLSSCTDLGCFDNVLEALDGIHAGGHFTIGGLGIDAFASAGDPAFFLHHSSIDRVWALWQSMDYANRTNQVYGTNTAFNRKCPLV